MRDVRDTFEVRQPGAGDEPRQLLVDDDDVLRVEPAEQHVRRDGPVPEARPGGGQAGLVARALRAQRPAVHVEEQLARGPAAPPGPPPGPPAAGAPRSPTPASSRLSSSRSSAS